MIKGFVATPKISNEITPDKEEVNEQPLKRLPLS